MQVNVASKARLHGWHGRTAGGNGLIQTYSKACFEVEGSSAPLAFDVCAIVWHFSGDARRPADANIHAGRPEN